MNTFQEEINTYLKTQSRNKIIIHKIKLNGLVPFNIGFELSLSINSLESNKKLSLKTFDFLEKKLKSAVIIHPTFGKILTINNVGILFEPELKINIHSLFNEFSKNNVLFVEWEGSIENTQLFFFKKSDKRNLNLNNLSHIIL